MSAEDLVSKIGVLCDEHAKLPETCSCMYLDDIYKLIIQYRKKTVKCDWCGKKIIGEPLLYKSPYYQTTKRLCPDDCLAKSCREIAEALRK